MAQPRVFISYCREDGEFWLGQFKKYLAGFKVDPWDDTRVQPGERWLPKIESALEHGDLALLLVTQGFIASRFIQEQELPVLLAKHRDRTTLFWVHCSSAHWEGTGLRDVQAAYSPDPPLEELNEPDRKRALKKITAKLAAAAKVLKAKGARPGASSARSATPAAHRPRADERAELARGNAPFTRTLRSYAGLALF
jgi:hypothetical protein